LTSRLKDFKVICNKNELGGRSRARVTSSGEMYPTTRPLMLCPSRIEGCCGHAGLCRTRPASICHIASLMTNISPARPVTSTLLLFAPCTCMYSCGVSQCQKPGVLPCLDPPRTVAILAQGTHWAAAVTQAFFANGRRQFIIFSTDGQRFSCSPRNRFACSPRAHVKLGSYQGANSRCTSVP
jgi:hypothetical protein